MEKNDANLEMIESLMNAANAALAEDRNDHALSLGRELETRRYSGGFEIQALALAKLNRREDAIRTLDQGVQKAPAAWPLWQLLANYYSDAERFEDSTNCYEQGLLCPNANASSLNLNYAICLLRQGKPNEALEKLALVRDPELWLKSMAFKLDALMSAGRHNEAVRTAESAIAQAQDKTHATEDLGMVHAQLADCLTQVGDNSDRALDHAWTSVQLNHDATQGLKVIRERANLRSLGNKLFRIMLCGTWHTSIEDAADLPGFFRNYEVAAESLNEAVSLALQFEPVEVRDSMKLEEHRLIEPSEIDLKGVYWLSGRSFFPSTENEE